MIVSQGLSKSFGTLQALAEVDFHIDQGQWVALLGPNGAGKTTLNRILAGLARPTAGRAQVADVWLHERPDQVRERIGVVSHHTLLYGELSALENLNFYAAMYGVPHAKDRIEQLLQQVGLWQRRHDAVRTFSRGMQQRLALSRAMLHQPTVLLLDEPFTGLDINATRLLTEFVQHAIADRVTVLMTTHDVDYALAHSQQVFVLRQGRLVLNQASPQLSVGDVTDLLEEQ
jgi:heme exporter protein A